MLNPIAAALEALQREEFELLSRLALVRHATAALEALGPAPLAARESLQVSVPASAANAPEADSDTTPSAVEDVASAVAAVSDTRAGEAEPAPEPVAVTPAPTRVGASALVKDASSTGLSVPDALAADINRWRPVLRRENLADIYRKLLLRRDRFSVNLPSEMNLANPDVVRTLENHLRHEEVPGYFELCARLKELSGYGHLYKRVRDKASAAIYLTYPELAGADAAALVPSGAHHFGALAGLVTRKSA